MADGKIEYFASLNGVELIDINMVAQQFTARGFITLLWVDEKLPQKVYEAGSSLPVRDGSYQSNYCLPDDGYLMPLNPQALFANALEFCLEGSGFAFDQSTGEIAQSLKWIGVFAQAMRLDRFPFDRVRCDIILKNQRKEYLLRGIQLKWMRMGTRIKIWDSWRDSVSMTMSPKVCQEYHMDSIEADVLTDPSRPRFFTRLQRRPWYYIWTVILPCHILGVVNCTAFMGAMDNLANRMDLNTTMLLTILALRLTTQTILPKVNYMTWLDYYYFGCIFFMVCVIILNVLLDGAGSGGTAEEKKRMLHTLCVVFMSSWIGLHVIMVTGIFREWWSPSWESIETARLEDSVPPRMGIKKIAGGFGEDEDEDE